ncbi:MliC family protein [Paracoccus sp. Z330]|uniref:MliC family protein n=1 Tax=Paracoccus onchidii TaxID=3017813 RepID=A0ABT4ZE60_9RHOB|nr:MliC family protein [Paracoccus onchidii]MDB6177643.1 MliC family protein [Paracoccus onchidii]
MTLLHATATGIMSMTLMGAPAMAGVALTLDLGPAGETTAATYRCDDGDLVVTYVNVGANSLALLQVDGEERVFVNVMSASGARYVSGSLEWWSKGDGAVLTDLQDEDSGTSCTASQE